MEIALPFSFARRAFWARLIFLQAATENIVEIQ
jgi:hypothetical protein